MYLQHFSLVRCDIGMSGIFLFTLVGDEIENYTLNRHLLSLILNAFSIEEYIL